MPPRPPARLTRLRGHLDGVIAWLVVPCAARVVHAMEGFFHLRFASPLDGLFELVLAPLALRYQGVLFAVLHYVERLAVSHDVADPLWSHGLCLEFSTVFFRRELLHKALINSILDDAWDARHGLRPASRGVGGGIARA